jgi:16S rRNA (guanine(966)-N(2))-methyltransferase RsmD
LAIEALSRGADKAYLVEKSQASTKIIRENLNICQFTDRANIVIGDAIRSLNDFKDVDFDIIFLDPPYGQGLAEKAIQQVVQLQLLKEDGVLCAETGTDEQLEDSYGELQQIDQRRYGSIMISLYGF